VFPSWDPHILTGPIGVSGARSGDLLAVTVEEISLCQNWGWNEIHSGDGVLPTLEKNDEVIAVPIDLATSEVVLPWGGRIPAQPFFGVMAVKPPRSTGPITSLIPGIFGGNMDVRLLGAGTTIYFPVHCLGAGFSVGDGHALQGDGEINGTAVETAMTGVFRFEVLRQAATVPFPFAMTADRLIAIAVHEDLNIAAVEVLRQAVQLLEEHFGLSSREAYRHASLCGNLIVSQLVNIKKGIHCSVDISTLRHREIRT
jgi:acetamidase/formamidase